MSAPAAATEPGDLDLLLAEAAARRDRAWGRRVTFSPKVFLPVTNLCRNFCDYCSFRRSPGDPGEWTMSPAEIADWLDRGRSHGCVEALLCLGDQPEGPFKSYRQTLRDWGHSSTVDYLVWASERALGRGLLPHTNAGLLSIDDMRRLKACNVSLGLMLENVSPRLCERGMPHHRAPDKRPERRLAMTRQAGELQIPFTSGLLIGIGETWAEREQTVAAICELHQCHGHIQEVIVQNFRARPGIRMAHAPEPDDYDIARTVALARIMLPDEVSVQAPPNLNRAATALLLRAGINDFGGISPVTPDYINHQHPWPHVHELAQSCAEQGYQLAPRLPVYPAFVDRPGFIDDRLRPFIATAQSHLEQTYAPLLA
jgi:FO synthase